MLPPEVCVLRTSSLSKLLRVPHRLPVCPSQRTKSEHSEVTPNAPIWFALFSCVCTHHMELISSQRSFLRISNNVSKTSQNTLFPISFLCHHLATHYQAPQIQLFDFGALYIYLLTHIMQS